MTGTSSELASSTKALLSLGKRDLRYSAPPDHVFSYINASGAVQIGSCSFTALVEAINLPYLFLA